MSCSAPVRRAGDAGGGGHVPDRTHLHEQRPALPCRDRGLDDHLRRYRAIQRPPRVHRSGRARTGVHVHRGLRAIIWWKPSRSPALCRSGGPRCSASTGPASPRRHGNHRDLSTRPRANKPRLIDLSLDLSAPLPLLATVAGSPCSSSPAWASTRTSPSVSSPADRGGSRALYASVLASRSVVLLFLAIGSLLVSTTGPISCGKRGQRCRGRVPGREDHHLHALYPHSIPPGVRFVAVGVLAAAAVNSGLISMASVLIQDFYRPGSSGARDMPETHFVWAGRVGMVLLALAYWQCRCSASTGGGATPRRRCWLRVVGDDLRLFGPARRLFPSCSPAAALPAR